MHRNVNCESSEKWTYRIESPDEADVEAGKEVKRDLRFFSVYKNATEAGHSLGTTHEETGVVHLQRALPDNRS